MYADDLVPRHGKHPEGVVIPKVVLGEEREPAQVVERGHVGGGDAGCRERFPVVGDIVDCVLQ